MLSTRSEVDKAKEKSMEENKRNVTAYSLGCIYAVEFGNVVKIGFTTDFENRIKSLKLTLRYRNEKDKIGKTYCSNEMRYARRAETFLHKRFKDRRIEGTELFRITFEEAEKAIKKVERLKLYSDDDRERHLEAERKSKEMFNSIFIDNGESEWATKKEMAKVFGVNVQTVSRRIKDILQSGELQEVEVCKESLKTKIEGKKQVTRKVKYYNLKMIIAVGFRIESGLGMKFRQWANDVIEKYSTQGCAIDLNAMANDYRKSEPWSEERKGSSEDSHK